MATLERLIKDLERAMVHAPNVRGWRDEAADLLNDALLHIGSLDKWSWLDRIWTMRVFEPLTLEAADYIMADPGAGDAAAMAFSFLMPAGWEPDDVLLLEGHTVTIDGVEYLIERAFGVTFATTRYYIILDPRFSAAGVTDDVVFNLDRYKMPFDMAELYAVQRRGDDGRLIGELSLAAEYGLGMDRDDPASEPVALLASHNLPSTYPDPANNIARADSIEAPTTAPTLAAAGGGSLNSGQEYEYRYCWKYAGMTSAMSPTATVKLGGGQGTVDLSGLETWEQETTTSPVGRERWVFRRTDEGPWHRVAIILNSTTDAFSDGGTQVLSAVGLHPREREFLNGGSYRHYRLWPTPSTRHDYEVRYLARIPRLVAKSDEPFMPPEFHQALVHYAAWQLAANSDNDRLIRYHQSRFEERMRLMRRRGLVSVAQRHTRHTMFENDARVPVHRVKAPVFLG